MAEGKKKKLPIHRSPRGVLVYPWVNKPDTKFNADGEFRTKLRLPESDAATKEFIALLDLAHIDAVQQIKEELKAKGKPVKSLKIADKPYKAELNDDEEETGNIVISFKQKAKGKNKKTGEEYTRTVKLYDAKGQELKKNVYGGSEGKVGFHIVPFYTAQVGAGISLRLLAVQVLKLVEGGGGASFDDCGFEAEDGYEADPDEAPVDEDEDEEKPAKGKKSKPAEDEDEGDDADF